MSSFLYCILAASFCSLEDHCETNHSIFDNTKKMPCYINCRKKTTTIIRSLNHKNTKSCINKISFNMGINIWNIYIKRKKITDKKCRNLIFEDKLVDKTMKESWSRHEKRYHLESMKKFKANLKTYSY